MEVTRVSINIVDLDRVKAFADIVFDDCFIVKGLKLIYTDKFFVSMPSRKRKDGSFADIAFPVKEETRKMIELAVLHAYEEERTSKSYNDLEV